MATTYTKLKDGSWGVRTTDTVRAGQRVTVTKKDGSTKSETVERVLWTGDGVSLCSLVASRPAATSKGNRAARRERSGRCRECGQPIEDAPYHRAMGGLCGSCAFDEYDC